MAKTGVAARTSVKQAEEKAVAANQANSKFKPEYCEQVKKLCKLGATDRDLCLFFNVGYTTIGNWKKQYPEFFVSVLKGKQESDMEMSESLFRSGTGYEYFEEKEVKLRNITGYDNGKPIVEERVEVVSLKRYKHPEPVSIIFWLKNRRPDLWRDVKRLDLEAGPDLIKATQSGAAVLDALKQKGFVELDAEYEIVGGEDKSNEG